MKPWRGTLITLAMFLGVSVAADANAGHAGGAHHGGSHAGHGHHHHFGGGALFASGALLYPWPYSYYFHPPWEVLADPEPVLYVEQFPGTPAAGTKGWIYCPEKAASYPEVADCPHGWQRIIPQEQAIRQGPAP
jgi:hypothetical protein